MTIIPYVTEGSLHSNSQYHFHTFRDAIDYAFRKENGPLYWVRFRILESEEDFIVYTFSKDNKYIMELCGYTAPSKEIPV